MKLYFAFSILLLLLLLLLLFTTLQSTKLQNIINITFVQQTKQFEENIKIKNK